MSIELIKREVSRKIIQPGYIYIASPYSASKGEMYEVVADFCAECIKLKLHVFSPIVHFHPMAIKHNLPTDADFWRDQDRAFLFTASAMIVFTYKGWKESRGVSLEIGFAEALNIPISYATSPDVAYMDLMTEV